MLKRKKVQINEFRVPGTNAGINLNPQNVLIAIRAAKKVQKRKTLGRILHEHGFNISAIKSQRITPGFLKEQLGLSAKECLEIGYEPKDLIYDTKGYPRTEVMKAFEELQKK